MLNFKLEDFDVKSNGKYALTPLTLEEMYFLTQVYTNVLYNSNSFKNLRELYSVDDLIQENFLVMFRRGLIQRFDPSKKGATQSKKYIVMISVKRNLIDILRKVIKLQENSLHPRQFLNLDAKFDSSDSNSDLLAEVIPDTSIQSPEQNIVFEGLRDKVFEVLSDKPMRVRNKNAVLKGVSPLLGSITLSERVVMYHTYQGYSAKEIASFFKNSPSPVNSALVSKVLNEAREHILSQVPLYKYI